MFNVAINIRQEQQIIVYWLENPLEMSNPDMEHTLYEECFSEYYQVQDDKNQDPTDEQTEAEHLGNISETIVMAPSVEDI